MNTTYTWQGNDCYRLSNMGAGSSRYGACEICKQHADTIYLQTKGVRSEIETDIFVSDEYKAKHPDWQCYNAGSTFGHRECLEGIRLVRAEIEKKL